MGVVKLWWSSRCFAGINCHITIIYFLKPFSVTETAHLEEGNLKILMFEESPTLDW